MAEFIDDCGSVFRHVMDAATAQAQDEATIGKSYVMGVDWGKHNDFTVLAVVDNDGALVAMDRFNQIDYSVQLGRLQVLADRFKPATIVAERNSMGDPLVEQLLRMGLPVQAFTTTQASKAQAIDALALGFEKGEIRILSDRC